MLLSASRNPGLIRSASSSACRASASLLSLINANPRLFHAEDAEGFLRTVSFQSDNSLAYTFARCQVRTASEPTIRAPKKAPSTKHQAPDKSQAPSIKRGPE